MTRQMCGGLFRLPAILLFSLQAPIYSQQDAGPVFRSNTQLVVEAVTVKDKSGKVIEGLTPKDFVLTEDGVPQTIQFAEFQRLEEAVEETKPALTTHAPSVTRNQIRPEPTGAFTYQNRRLITIYFDMTAMQIPDQIRALSASRKFIRTQMTRADLMAVMAYKGDAVKILNDFTSDKEELEKSLETLTPGEGQGFDENSADASTADNGTAFGQDDSEFNIFNTDRQLAALQTAVRMLGGLKEKKSFIYFASGLRLNGVNNQAQLTSTVNAAVKANVSFFPIDARGLVASAPLGDATVGSPGGVAMYSGASALVVSSNFQRSQDTLHSLAADTGGKALLDYNDLSKGIVQAQEAIGSYYVVGYYTTKTALDGRFRKIKITLAGDTAAKLEFRQGYYAGKTFGKFTSTDRERQLEDALMLGDPITELTIAMEVDYFQLNGAEYFVPVAIKIPGSELALARHGGAEHTVIDFIGEVKDDYGITMSNVRDKVDIKLTGATAQELAHRPVQYDTGFTLLPGKYTIKLLARDDETGRIGTCIQQFVIPNLNKENKRVPISSVILSSQLIDMSEAIYSTRTKANAPIGNPLIQNGQKLLPNVTRVFNRNKNMYVYRQAYEPGAEAPRPLVAFVTFYRGQTKAFETPLLPVSEVESKRLRTMPLRFSLALNTLPAGRYNCQVTILDPTAQKASFWQAPVALTQ